MLILSHIPPNGNGLEKRAHSRVDFQVDAEVAYNVAVVTGMVDNLSMTGMFFKTTLPIPEGRALDIVIRLAGVPITINVKGEVVRSGGEGAGIIFTEIGLDSLVHLKNVVAYNTEDADIIEDEINRSMENV